MKGVCAIDGVLPDINRATRGAKHRQIAHRVSHGRSLLALESELTRQIA
jgi:hypothetical protein